MKRYNVSAKKSKIKKNQIKILYLKKYNNQNKKFTRQAQKKNRDGKEKKSMNLKEDK